MSKSSFYLDESELPENPKKKQKKETEKEDKKIKPDKKVKYSGPDQIYRRKLILLIKEYETLFKEKLKIKPREKIDQLTIEELELHLKEIKFELGCESSSSYVSFLFYQVTAFLELLYPGEPFYMKGLTLSLSQDKQFQELLEEVRLEYQDFSYVTPHIRFIKHLGLKLISVFSNNKTQMQKIESTENISPYLVNKYSEL
jgi:hypothetical protein